MLRSHQSTLAALCLDDVAAFSAGLLHLSTFASSILNDGICSMQRNTFTSLGRIVLWGFYSLSLPINMPTMRMRLLFVFTRAMMIPPLLDFCLCLHDSCPSDERLRISFSCFLYIISFHSPSHSASTCKLNVYSNNDAASTFFRNQTP